MELIGELLRLLTHPKDLILAFGPLAYLGMFAILFAETGLFIGFFLPGDSLLFAAGVVAAAGGLDLILVCLVCTAAAILGNLTGFAFGRAVGRPLFERPDSRFFKRRHLLAAEAFYAKHGGKTIVLARFLPFVRTFAPIVAGASRMAVAPFVLYTVVGGILWGTGLPLAGFFVGNLIPDIDRVLLPVILVIVAISVLPTLIHVLRANREQIGARLPGRPRPVTPGEPTED